MVALGTFDQIVAYFLFPVIFFLGLAVSALFPLRRQPPHSENVVLTPGYPFTPIAFLILILAMLLLLTIQNPREAILGSAVVLAGWPVYNWVIAQRPNTKT